MSITIAMAAAVTACSRLPATAPSPTQSLPNASPTKSATVTAIPSRPTRSPTLPSTIATLPTITSTATNLPPHGTAIADILRPTDDCQLPCWRGILPGRSTMQDMGRALIQVGAHPPGFPEGEFETAKFFLSRTDPAVNLWVGINYMNDEVVTQFEIWILDGTPNPALIELAALDQEFGPPESILYNSYIGTNIHLDYPALGLLVTLVLSPEDTQDLLPPEGQPDICLANLQNVSSIITLYAPDTEPRLLAEDGQPFLVQWPSRMHLTTNAFWQELLGRSECIPGPY